jgi:zinc protease
MRSKIQIAVLLVVLALVAFGFSQSLPPGVQQKASAGGITEYLFPNGLRVLLYPDQANPKVTINMTYLVGSRHEGYGETGMAHLLEHMNFIQTTNGREIKKEIVDRGAQWNGSTSYDRTNYYETITAGDENLKWALGLEADRMVNVKMEKALLDTEMTVVRNEFERGENSPQRVLEERVVATAYLWHNYGKSTIGSREDIEKVPIDRLAAFYRKYYQPDNAVLVIAGQFDPSKALSFVAETCGKIPRPQRQLDQTYTVEPVQDGERYVELRRVGNGQEVLMVYHAPAAAHPDAAALQVLAGIMGGGGGFGGRGGGPGGGAGGSGRLSKALVDSKKALSASMSFQQLHDPGFIRVSASLSNDQSLEEARKIILQTVDGVASEPPTKDEVERVKTRLLRGLEQRMTDAQQLGLGLSTPIAQGDWRLMFLDHDRIKDVTPEDVVRVAKLYFKASNRTVGVFIPDAQPDRTSVPATPDLEALLKNYKSSVTVARGEAFDPTPANIENRVVRTKLANGMKVAILPRRSTAGMVSAAIELHFGDQESLAGQNAAAQIAASLLSRGTRTRTRQQIQDEMDRLNARITVSGGGGGGFGGRGGGGGGFAGGGAGISGASASITAPSDNFVAALRLAVEMLREPAFSEADFEQVRNQRIAAIENSRTDPASLAAQVLQRHLSPYPKGDPRSIGTPDEQIEELKKVTLDDVKKFHDRFYGAAHGELVLVGQFDQAALQQAAAELLGNWNSPAPYQRLASNYAKVEPINLKIETPDKQNAQFEAGLRIRMTEEDPDYPAMVLASTMFGGSITARMPNRIRNVEGLSYGASSRFSAPADGDAAIFSGTVSSHPANTPKVEASFRNELDKALKGGFTAEEIAAAKKAYHDQQIVARSQEAALIRLLAVREQAGRTMKWDEQLEARIQELTPDQINAAFRRHLDPAALSIVKAGDFKAAGVY